MLSMLGSLFKTAVNTITEKDYSRIYTQEELNSELSKAIEAKDESLAIHLINQGARCNRVHLYKSIRTMFAEQLSIKIIDSGVMPISEFLDMAIKNSYGKLIIKILQSGIHLTSNNITSAIWHGNENLALQIIEFGAKPTAKTLEQAISSNYQNLALRIIESEVELGTGQIGKALKYNQKNVATKIVDKLYTNDKLLSQVFYALINDDIDSAIKLITASNIRHSEILSKIINSGLENKALVLIENGIKPDSENLVQAVAHHFVGLTKKIISVGIRPTSQHINAGIFPQHITFYNNSVDEILSILELHVQFDPGNLYKAIQCGQNVLALKMLELGVKPSYRHFEIAALTGQRELVEKIVKISPEIIYNIPASVCAEIYLNKPKIWQYLDIKQTELIQKEILTILIAKGHFTRAKEFFEQSKIDDVAIDPIELLSSSLQIDLKSAIEQNKLGAIVNLISRAGIHIPQRYKNLIGNTSDNITEREFEFIHGLMHKLAEHYILFAKNELLKQVGSDQETLKLVGQIFSRRSTSKEKFEALEKLRELNPQSKHLQKAKGPFDVIFFTVGTAIEQIDHDFALEVLALNGIVPPKLEETLSGYRGMRGDISDQELEDMFIYGHRAFSAVWNQKTLGYHVKSEWSKTEAEVGSIWDFGGTYITLEPSWAVIFASGSNKAIMQGRKIIIESLTEVDNPIFYGKNLYEYEIVPAGVRGNEIVAIYELGDDDKVARVFKNPYIDAAPRYKVGDDITYDAKAVETYERLYKATETYRDYDHFLETYVYQPERLDQFYESRPELPNQVSVSPKALSEVRLDQDVLAFQCLDDRFTQFVMHSSLPEVKTLQPAPLPIMPDSGTPHLPATPETSSALTVPHSQESRAVSTYFDISLPSIESVSNAITTINTGRCIVHGAKQFAEYFISTTREVFSPKVEHKYVRQLQENAVEVLKYIKKVGKDLDNKDPQNIEAFTEEALKIERKINSRTSFTQKQMKEIIDNLIEVYKDAKKVAKESGSRASRYLTAAQNLENLSEEILQGHSR